MSKTVFAKIVYNKNNAHGYTRHQWVGSISGSHSGETESALMYKLKQRHGHDTDLTIISYEFR